MFEWIMNHKIEAGATAGATAVTVTLLEGILAIVILLLIAAYWACRGGKMFYEMIKAKNEADQSKHEAAISLHHLNEETGELPKPEKKEE